MKKIIVLIIILAMLVIPPSFSAIAIQENKSIVGPELHVGVFGASILMPRRAGFIISNNGNATILDIHWTFSIKSVSNDEINISYAGEFESLGVYDGYMYTIPNVNGFGFVTLSIISTSLNAGEATETIYGFQIGRFILSKTYLLAWY